MRALFRRQKFIIAAVGEGEEEAARRGYRTLSRINPFLRWGWDEEMGLKTRDSLLCL